MGHSISIGFSKHKGFAPMSNVIRWVLSTPYSHVYLKFEIPGVNQPLMFHSTGKGINILSYANFLENNEEVLEHGGEITQEANEKLINYIFKMAGTNPYGYLQNIGIFIIDVLNLIGFEIKSNPINDGVNCSELMAMTMQEIKGGPWTDKDYNLITPRDIWDAITEKGML